MKKYINSSPLWLRTLYPRGLIWDIETGRPEIFLTFDDGPVPGATPWVLDTLGKYNIQATFFCVGENVENHPEIYAEVLAQGHSVGNHTFHHVKAWKTDYYTYLSEVGQCGNLVKSPLFRPPHGQITRKLALELRKEYHIIMWSVLTGDYDRSLSGKQCLANAVKHTKPGAIIVFHDSQKANERLVYALPQYIDYCLQQGFSFRKM